MIATDTLDALTAEVAVNAAVAHLRGCFPGLHFTECSEDDVPVRATPVRETTDYLIPESVFAQPGFQPNALM